MNILFLAYEVESVAISELSDYYKKQGHHCYILNCDFWTFYSNKNFYEIYKDKCDKYFNLEDEYLMLDNTSSKDQVDYSFLKNFEDKYDFKFNDLIRVDPILYTSTHERDYYNIPPKFIKHKWIELLSSKLESICIQNNIDKAVTINNNYFVKNLGNKIFPKLNIEYLTILTTRIDDHYLVYDNFGLGSPASVYSSIDSNSDNDFNDKKIDEFINSVAIKNMPAYKSYLQVSDKKSNFLKDLIETLRNSHYLVKSNLLNFYKNKKYKNKYFAPRPIKELIMPYRNTLFRKKMLEASNILKKYIPDDINYYYYGLHFHPESSLLTLSKFHDESECILKICADLDVNTFLVIKENPSMMGERHPSFYKKLLSVPNLILLHPSVDSRILTKNSLGVIGLSGTILVEACILNKPAFVIGEPEYLALSYVQNYSKDNLISSVSNIKNNIREYIRLCLTDGTKLDMFSILYSPFSKDFKYNKWKSEVMKITHMLNKHIQLDD